MQILTIIEEAEFKYDKLDKVINEKIKEYENLINEIKKMTHEEFLQYISKSLFGIALKEYYIQRYRKAIDELKTIKQYIDNLIEYYEKDRFIFEYTLTQKYYKGYKRQIKKAIKMLINSKNGGIKI